MVSDKKVSQLTFSYNLVRFGFRDTFDQHQSFFRTESYRFHSIESCLGKLLDIWRRNSKFLKKMWDVVIVNHKNVRWEMGNQEMGGMGKLVHWLRVWWGGEILWDPISQKEGEREEKRIGRDGEDCWKCILSSLRETNLEFTYGYRARDWTFLKGLSLLMLNLSRTRTHFLFKTVERGREREKDGERKRDEKTKREGRRGREKERGREREIGWKIQYFFVRILQSELVHPKIWIFLLKNPSQKKPMGEWIFGGKKLYWHSFKILIFESGDRS